MKHLTKLLAAAGVATLALAGCGGGGSAGQTGQAKDAASFKACAVSDAGGWDDKSFNESAYNGLKAAQSKLGIQINTAESSSDADFKPNVETMVSDNCNLIIGVGFNLEKAMHASADENKDLHYALVDSSFSDGNNNTVTVENGRPLLFNTAEAAYRDAPLDAYEVCARIARIAARKVPDDDSLYADYINQIGMETELVSIMKGSVVLVKR